MAGIEWTPQEAYCAFATLAIETDGSVGAEEQDALMSYLRKSEELAAHSDKLGDLIKKVHSVIGELGEAATLDSAGAALPSELRDKAFRAAVNLTWSDDDSDAAELEFLHRAARALQMSEQARDAILGAARPQ